MLLTQFIKYVFFSNPTQELKGNIAWEVQIFLLTKVKSQQ